MYADQPRSIDSVGAFPTPVTLSPNADKARAAVRTVALAAGMSNDGIGEHGGIVATAPRRYLNVNGMLAAINTLSGSAHDERHFVDSSPTIKACGGKSGERVGTARITMQGGGGTRLLLHDRYKETS